jgi:hypothetical protein
VPPLIRDTMRYAQLADNPQPSPNIGSIALGILGALVYAEVQGESQLLAQYIAVSTASNFGASGANVNVSASTITYTVPAIPIDLCINNAII